MFHRILEWVGGEWKGEEEGEENVKVKEGGKGKEEGCYRHTITPPHQHTLGMKTFIQAASEDQLDYKEGGKLCSVCSQIFLTFFVAFFLNFYKKGGKLCSVCSQIFLTFFVAFFLNFYKKGGKLCSVCSQIFLTFFAAFFFKFLAI